ncbi:HET-domain-containing protein, partial [Hyaloscypha hepaticicola]
MLEAARPRPEKYRQALANNIYEYEGLNVHSKEIRLIKLRRNLITGVRSSLEHFSSEDAPAYEAVSYTWDSPIKDHLVFFDGCWLPTTRNVYRILLDRASLFRTRWLWIDAVCINQENDAEKSVQVGMMGEIYHGAERVIVWLGDVAVKTSEVIAAMFLLEKLQYNIRNYEQYKLKLDSMELFRHPYWQRMWIIQEVAKAR